MRPPPVALVGVACLLAGACVTPSACAAQHPTRARSVGAPLVTVEPTARWLEHASADDSTARRLYVSGTWRNVAGVPLHVWLVFTVYASDGERMGACDAVEKVAAGETAHLFCTAPHFRRDTGRDTGRDTLLQLTTRVGRIVDERTTVAAAADTTGLTVQGEFPEGPSLVAWARVRAPGAADGTSVRYRLYDSAGVQVASFESAGIELQPEVARRVESFGVCAIVPRQFGPVARVRAEAFGPDR